MLNLTDEQYKHGLQQLRNALRTADIELQNTFFIFEARLNDYLGKVRRYGLDAVPHAELIRIIDALNTMSIELLSTYFLDLCKLEPPEQLFNSTLTPAPSSESYQQWKNGETITIEKQTYWLHTPLPATPSSDQNVLFQQSPAQVPPLNRLVWLKQIALLRSTLIAQTWLKSLSDEQQIMVAFSQRRVSAFPRLFTSHFLTQSATLVYDMPPGNSFNLFLGPQPAPLDAFSARLLLRSLTSLCKTLHFFHQCGYAHRALTPEIVFFDQGKQTYLRDAGLVMRPFEPGENPSPYQAPEQKRLEFSSSPGPQTDIYLLGSILYHLLTGQLPAQPPYEVVPPTSWNPHLPATLNDVLLRALHRSPAGRWPTMLDFSQEIKNTL